MNATLLKASALCNGILPAIEQLGDKDILTYARLLGQRLAENQAYITIIGETSTGKTTIINGLFDKDVFIPKASPTTGTVVQVLCRDTQYPSYYVINKDATQEVIDEALFTQLTLKPDQNTLRLQLQHKPKFNQFIGLSVFDTPGYNSLVVEHEVFLREFIPNSDLIVFVCGYRTGFNQVDQDLYEVVRESIPERDTPILFVINRVPKLIPENDKRIMEMTKNAQDSLLQDLKPILIQSIDKKIEPNGRPDSCELWEQINEIINNPTLKDSIDNQLLGLFEDMLSDLLIMIDSKIDYFNLQVQNAESLNNQHSILIQARSKSIDAIKASSSKLKNLVTPNINAAAQSILVNITSDINSSNKWLGKDDAYVWIEVHALPIEIKRESKIIENVIKNELDRLDDELEDIANTAVKDMKRSVNLKSNIEADIAESIIKRITTKAIGRYIGKALTNLGGRGGVAAGAGNFVKMAVKRAGKLFKVKFPRPVYDQIGRVFTKKLIAKATVILQVAIEAIDFVIDANRWKIKLLDGVESALQTWKNEVTKELLNQVIPDIQSENMEGVEMIYGEDIKNMEKAMKLGIEEREKAISDLNGLRSQISTCAKNLKLIK